MNTIKISFLVLLFVFAGCAPQKTDPNAELELRMERGDCFGTCPVYKVSVRPDNKVIFEGKKYTNTQGGAEDTITSAKKAQLISAIDEARFFSLNNSYAGNEDCPSMATDHPSVNLTITLAGKSKTIRHNLGCSESKEPHATYPAELYALENKIDEIIGTDRWIKADK